MSKVFERHGIRRIQKALDRQEPKDTAAILIEDANDGILLSIQNASSFGVLLTNEEARFLSGLLLDAINRREKNDEPNVE